jgi:hypothetical protein
MKHPRTSLKLVSLFIFAAIPILISAEAVAQQNTVGYIPGVQLSSSQSAQVAVSNISNTATSITINILNAEGGIFMTRTTTVQASKTFVFTFSNGAVTAV